jgi:hypothetical protein
MNNRTRDSHYPWTKKWGAGQREMTHFEIPKMGIEETKGEE